jgi:hypothetical protein
MSGLAMVWIACLVAVPESPVVGVIVPRPVEEVDDAAWAVLARLGAVAEVHLHGEAASREEPFGFTAFDRALAVFGARGIPVATTLLPHFGTIPIMPAMDSDGVEYDDRHNPFDPAFIAEWDRFHRACRELFLGGKAPARAYLSPPSYFGEIEYYMGTDWSNPKFLCYDPSAREQFEGWRRERLGEVAALDPLPRPGGTPDSDWLDLMAWRREYLAGLVGDQARHFEGIPGMQLGIKVAVGDYAAVHGVDSGLTVSRCAGEHVDIHCTNVHAISDVMYADTLARRYGSGFLIVENDGNRYSVPETRKALTVALLTGADMFSYAYDAHLLDRAGNPTDAGRALENATRILAANRRKPVPSPVAFLHSVTTTGYRSPTYRNHAVARCYDSLLVNGADPQALGRLDWGQALGWPGVIGEQCIRDGALDALKMVIIPGEPDTLLPAEVWERLADYANAGGRLVVLGAMHAWEDREVRQLDLESIDRVTLMEPLPGGHGRVADPRWTHELPNLVRELAEEADVAFPLRMTGADGHLCRGLAARYMGFDKAAGCHRVYAGAWDGTPSFHLHLDLEGPVQLLLIDEPCLKVTGDGVVTVSNPGEPGHVALWTDPTNAGAAGRMVLSEITVQGPVTVHFSE